MINYLEKQIYQDSEFISIISDIINNETVLEMKNFRQHCSTTCFEHCLAASYLCYQICKKYHLDYISCARAAMVHDLFLYDWRKRIDGRKGLHAFTHPFTAYENASKIFNLNEKEKDIILKHMWPVTFKLPKFKESFVLTYVDKKCALMETWSEIISFYTRKKFFRYAYVFFTIMIFKI